MRKAIRFALTMAMLLLSAGICALGTLAFSLSIARGEFLEWQTWALLAFGIYGLLKCKVSFKYLRELR